MNASRVFNLALALLVALWTPAWCCCARLAESDAQAQRGDASHCERCNDSPQEGSDSPAPHDPGQCPHSAARAVAAIEKPANVQLPAIALLGVIDAIDNYLLPVLRSDRPAQSLRSAPPDASLLALGCMLLV